MSLLERVIVAHRCRSTHHYIAMDALTRIEGPDAEKWRNLLVLHHDELLAGAKAPDAVFKDFKNHVLHVGEGEWGGARDAAMEWYGNAVDELRNKKWDKAVYALGVLSHYYADPIQPFHTGQTEEEGTMHRALEWSVAKSRDVIVDRIEEIGYPNVPAGDGPGFVSDMVRAGADKSHPHYQTLLDHYDLEAGVKNPPAGLDETLIDVFAELVAYATSGLAVLYARAFKEAAVAPPKVHITVPGYLATLDIPLRWVTKKLDDAGDRRTVEAMYKEYKATGKVIKKLPDDDKAIRKIHAKQVLRVPLKELNAQELKPFGTKHEPRPGYEPAPELVIDDEDEIEAALPEPAVDIEPETADMLDDVSVPLDEYELEDDVEAEELDADSEEPVNEETYQDIDLATDAETPDAPELVAAALADAEASAEFAEAELETQREVEAEEADEFEVDEAYLTDETENNELEDEFSLEELAAFDENLTETTHAETPAATSFFESSVRRGLSREDDVVDAPSIGKKTARRLAKLGISTIGELLDCDIEETAFELDVRHIDEQTLIDWKDQTQLMIEVSGLRVHDAQILVGAGIRSAEDLSNASVQKVFHASMGFLASSEGARIIRGDHVLEEAEVDGWIGMAREAKSV